MRRFWDLIWSHGAGPVDRAARIFQSVLVAASLVVGVLQVFGFVDVSGRLLTSIILLAIGSLLAALLLDTAQRRSLAEDQQDILHAARASLGKYDVREIGPYEINPGLTQLLSDSDRWSFRGGSGRYLRYATFTTLSLIRDREVPIDVQILDPRDQGLCAAYARYRAVQRTSEVRRADEGDPRTILHDLLAVIYAAAWFNVRSRISAGVILLRSFSPFRYDIGSGGLFVTVSDPSERALFAADDSWYYSSLLDELRQSRHGHPSLVLPTNVEYFPEKKEDVRGDAVKQALEGTLVVEPPEGALKEPLLTGAADPNRVDFDEIAERAFPVASPY